jgi:hypothetical protein
MSPSTRPTFFPSIYPTVLPSQMPSLAPSPMPSLAPSSMPSLAPSPMPSLEPSLMQSLAPSPMPIVTPSLNPTAQINTIINSKNSSSEAKTLTYIFMGLFLFMCSIASFMVFYKIKNKLVIINNKYFKKQSLVNDENEIIKTNNLSASLNKITPSDDDCSSDRSSIISVDCDIKKIHIDNSSDEEV